MSNYRRLYQRGGCYFFTVVTYKRAPILINYVDRLRESFRYAIDKLPFTIDAIVIMPDHLHCIWTLPEDSKDFSKRWFYVKQYFSRGISADVNGRGEKLVWQRRFWEHLIIDEDDLKRHIDYIHYNPVKHGLSLSPVDWKESSFLKFCQKGYYEKGWGDIKPKGIIDMEME